MPAERPMSVVLCWHMHQPEYRDLRTGTIHQPWTYLHAIKDYTDMAAHLEANPTACAVVNFVPILLEQLEEYIGQIRDYFRGHGTIREPLLAELAEPALPGEPRARLQLMQDCLRANRERMIDRFEPYRRLASMARWYQKHPQSMIYATNQFLADLLVWYHLSWLGEMLQRDDSRVASLRKKAAQFTVHDRRELLQIILEQMESIVPRYLALAAGGQVELCLSPYAHPIIPLLLELGCARESMADAPLPSTTRYPGGEQRARWHLQRGLEVFERVFGRRPTGIWPPEGGLSQQTLALFAESGFRWTASGGCVLYNSHQPGDHDCNHRVYRFGDAPIDCFFRDDGLSDLIGFSYSRWHAKDAVADLVGHMENIAHHCPDRRDCLITVILDGENAWEYYPENGYHFLDELYRVLCNHPQLRLTTFERFLEENNPRPSGEKRLTAGSWVYGTFSTWIGDPDKNRAWELLVEAKRVFDEQLACGALTPEEVAAAERQLAVCEGSDWFWWFGDYNPAATVGEFDQLYRIHLANLYQMLNREAPLSLTEVISRGGGHPALGGVMRQQEGGGGLPR
jgi:alpha-amylase/alpha-mannosidase (GH57 family)